MWASKNKHTIIKRSQSGFTIVELLIVIVVIAILAAITIAAYNGIQQRARDSAAKSDLGQSVRLTEMANTDPNIGSYPKSASDVQNLKIKLSRPTYQAAIYCYRSAGDAWALVVETTDGKAYYVSNSTTTPTPYSGTVGGVSGATICPNVGVSSPGWQWYLTLGGSWWAGAA